MNNRQVAHAWAGQQKESGRGSHFFFSGPSIYSYGAHFEIARILPQMINGRRVVLFTTRDYSMTTAKHKSYVRSAIVGREVFHVPHVDVVQDHLRHADNVAHYLERAKEAHEKARKALAWGKLYGREEASHIEEGARYLKTFARQIPKTTASLKELRALIRKQKAGKLWTAAEMALFDARELRAKETAEKRRAKDAIKWARRNQEYLGAQMARDIDARLTLAAWVKCETDALPQYGYDQELPTMLRIKDRRIETSRGAQITLRAAVRLWESLIHPEIEAPIGLELDGFRVEAWDGAVLTIGCHKITAAELARMAAVLGLKGSLAAPAAAGAAQ